MFEVSHINKTASKTGFNNSGKVIQRKSDSSNPLAEIISSTDLNSRIQTKLKIGKSGDKYEKEADKAADEVTSNPNEVIQPSVQLKLEDESGRRQPEEEEEPVQEKSETGEEREDDTIQKQEEEEEPVQLKTESEKEEKEPIRRQSEEEEEEEPVQAKSVSENEEEDLQGKDAKRIKIDSEFEQKLSSQKGNGAPLSEGIKNFMEPRLRADLGKVRLHAGSTAVEMNKQMKSQAFTVGGDVFFNEGKLKPESKEGKKLLVHELTHVIQQGKAERKEPAAVKTKPESENTAEPPAGTSKERETNLPAGQTQSVISVSPALPGKEIKSEAASEEKPVTGKPIDIKKTEKAGKEKGETKPIKGTAAETPGAGAVEKGANVEALPMQGKSEDVMKSFTEARPSQIAVSYPSLGSTVTSKLNEEQKSTAESLPPLKAQTAGSEKLTAKEGAEPKKESADIDKGISGPEPPKPEVMEQKNFGEPPQNKQIDKQLDRAGEGGFFSWFRNQFKSVIGSVATTDPGLNTSAGARPEADLSGEADPNRIEKQKSEGNKKADMKKTETVDAIKKNPGKENIQPLKVDEEKKLAVKEEAETEIETKEDKGMKDYAELPYPSDMREAADNKLAPLTNKSLAKQREEVTAAANKRDSDKAAEMKKAEEENAKLNTEAEKEQKNIVDKSRNDVDAKQKEGMKEADDKLKEFDKEASDEQKSQNEKVEKRIKDDKDKADKKLNDAEKEAQKEKEKGEQEAKRKKEELKKESKKQSWWDRAVNAVKSAVKAITSAIDKVFDAVRKAVKTIIDAAKNAALAVIEAGRKWIVQQLDNFGRWIKDKVNKYIGSVFPGIAKRINAAIDAAVNKAKQAVNFVADKLKKGVEALANAITNAINSILNKFQAALKAAVQIAGALLTGDFAEALKIAFYAACEIAGINPKPIIDFLNYAGDTIVIIFKNPVQFFLNVVHGVKKGLDQFLGNIKKHLLNGLIAWLTGAISEAGITLPEKFDLKGIFSLVMQILGLTYQNIRAKVVKKLGPGGEEIVSNLESAVSFLKELVTRGPIVLWEKVKEKLTDLKETVIGGIRDWIITTVIKEGVIWLISLLNPASAIAKALKLLYDIVMFFVERYQQIVDFVKSVFESVGALARGSIGKAANAVENALGRSVPVIISFMASLLGLGGISKTIKNIIGKVRKPIDNALDKVIDWIVKKGKALLTKGKGLLSKGKESIKKGFGKLFNWWKYRKNFKASNGSDHQIYYKGKGRSAKLYMHSDEENEVKYFLDNYKGEGKISEAREAYNSMTSAINEMNDIYQKGTPEKQQDLIKKLEPRIETHRDALLAALKTLEIKGPAGISKSYLTFGSASETSSYKHAIGEPITQIPGNTVGTPTGGAQILKEAAKVRTARSASRSYVQAHLISHQLHGPAKPQNLVMAPGSVNKGELQNIEDRAKVLKNKGTPFYYGVKAEMHPEPSEEDKKGDKYFAKNLYYIPPTEVTTKNAVLDKGKERWVLKINPASEFKTLVSNMQPPRAPNQEKIDEIIISLKNSLEKNVSTAVKENSIRNAVTQLKRLSYSSGSIAALFNEKQVKRPDYTKEFTWTSNIRLIKDSKP